MTTTDDLPASLPRPDPAWFVRPDGTDGSSGMHGVPHTLIVDNAGGHLMQHGLVVFLLGLGSGLAMLVPAELFANPRLALSAHLVVRPDELGPRNDAILDEVKRELREAFGIDHTTLQIESSEYAHVYDLQH